MPQAGWYDDPESADRARWWDGAQWTEHVRERLDLAPPPSEGSRLPGAAPSSPPEVIVNPTLPVGGWIAPPSYGLLSAFLRGIRGIVDFRGRASRSEFWFFFLGQYLVLLVILAVAWFGFIYVPSGVPFQLFNTISGFVIVASYFALQLALLAVSVRRVHDMNLRGWWALIPIFNPFGFSRAGTPGPNRYG